MLFTFRCTVIAVYTFKTRDLHQTKAKIEPRSLVQTVSIFRCKRFCQSRNSVSKRVKVHNLEVAGGTGRTLRGRSRDLLYSKGASSQGWVVRHEHDIFKCTRHEGNNVCSFSAHTYVCVNSEKLFLDYASEPLNAVRT